MSDGGDERVGSSGVGPDDGATRTDGSPGMGADPSTDTGVDGAFEQRVQGALSAVRTRRPQAGSPSSTDPLGEYTTGQRSLDPSVRLQWLPRVTVVALVLSMVLTGIAGAAGLPLALGGLAFVVLLGLGVALVVLRYRRWLYQIRADAMYLERGVIVHRRTHVPYVRIQHVDTSRGPFERWLGLSTLVVYTAGSRGADVSIPGLQPDEAHDLQQRVKQLTIETEGGDAL